MKNKIITITLLGLLTFGYSSRITSSEAWVDYDDVSKISLGTSKNMVVSILGEPILVLADSDEGSNIVNLYYNYHVKKYMPNKLNSEEMGLRTIKSERETLLKFTFEDDELIGWEEDKLTLAMAKAKNSHRSSSVLQYVSLLLNLILIVEVF